MGAPRTRGTGHWVCRPDRRSPHVAEPHELPDPGSQQTSALAVRGLFVFIGARPATGWLAGQLAQDNRGFLLTGTSIPQTQLDDTSQLPLFLETSRPGVFAVGDVRSGSVKRAATAIGEGSMAVRLVFERLQATGSAVADPPRADGTRRRAGPSGGGTRRFPADADYPAKDGNAPGSTA